MALFGFLRENVIQAIQEQSADDSARLVYADWLEERGGVEADTRAEFLRVQHTLMTAQPAAHLRLREAELRAAIDPVWLCLIGDTKALFEPMNACAPTSGRYVAQPTTLHDIVPAPTIATWGGTTTSGRSRTSLVVSWNWISSYTSVRWTT